MYTEDTNGSIITAIVFLAWIGLGIYLSYRTRESGCGTKFAVAFFCTKGFVLFWTFYGGYILVIMAKNFIAGMKEGNVECQQKDQKDKDN